jgi:hypothetical protein
MQPRHREPLSRIPLILTYHPALYSIGNIVKRHFRILQQDEGLKEVFPAPPLLAFRQPRNLHANLAQSRLDTESTSSIHGAPCHKRRCQVCKHFSNVTGIYNCDSSNVIYSIRCRKCHISYIGETNTSFRLRFNNHKSSIRKKTSNLPVASHFGNPSHSEDDIAVDILAGHFRTTKERRLAELKWIIREDTHRSGLKRDIGFLSLYPFFQSNNRAHT